MSRNPSEISILPGFSIDAVGFTEFEADPTLISSYSFSDLQEGTGFVPYSRHGMSTEYTSEDGSKLLIQSYMEDKTVVNKSILIDSTGQTKYILVSKFKPDSPDFNKDVGATVPSDVTSKAQAMLVLRDFLTGSGIAPTTSELQSLEAMYRDNLNTLYTLNPLNPSLPIDTLSRGFAQATPFAAANLYAQAPDILKDSLAFSIGATLVPPPVQTIGALATQQLLPSNLVSPGAEQ
ncbi:MAG: hypothetical protein ACRENF_03090 [Thermodesulfobacteriota bacterium]